MRYHFLHIGKTGGTAFGEALGRSGAAHQVDIHGHEFLLSDLEPGQKFFFFLRDPVTRFVSGFYSRYRQGLPRSLHEWEPGEAVAFAKFANANQLAEALSSANEVDRAEAVAAMTKIRHVRQPYSFWFGTPAALAERSGDLAFVGMTETLEADFERLKQLGIVPSNAALPMDDVGAHRTPSKFDRSLSDRAVRNIRIWYKADFEYLDLCRQIRRERWLLD